ncbi:MAG: hypothetical protein AAF741_14580 [Bacteroidota bacterium]
MLGKFFNRRKNLSVDQITFQTFGWNLRDNTKTFRSWIKPGRTGFIGIEIYNEKYSCYPASLTDIVQVERMQILEESNGGLIDCSINQVLGFDYIKVVLKEPQSPSGMSYHGTIIIPLAEHHVKIMINYKEVGVTGIRESTIFPKWMMENPGFESDKNGKIIGWLTDPFDSGFREGNLMNFSEDIRFDKQFPSHPLSLVRNNLDEIISTIQIDNDLERYR